MIDLYFHAPFGNNEAKVGGGPDKRYIASSVWSQVPGCACDREVLQ